jgi:hypothetical protein
MGTVMTDIAGFEHVLFIHSSFVVGAEEFQAGPPISIRNPKVNFSCNKRKIKDKGDALGP